MTSCHKSIRPETSSFCDTCRHTYCLEHRFKAQHGCDSIPRAGLAATTESTAADKGLAALQKLKAWGAARKAKLNTTPKKAPSAAVAQYKAVADLKRTAKGDEKVDPTKRIYLFVEAQNDTVTAKIRKGEFWYSMDWSMGKVLDVAAKQLQVQNNNNMAGGEVDKLRIFHIEGGRLLDFSEKLGAAVQTGNTIVLLRGVEVLPQPPAASEP